MNFIITICIITPLLLLTIIKEFRLNMALTTPNRLGCWLIIPINSIQNFGNFSNISTSFSQQTDCLIWIYYSCLVYSSIALQAIQAISMFITGRQCTWTQYFGKEYWNDLFTEFFGKKHWNGLYSQNISLRIQIE